MIKENAHVNFDFLKAKPTKIIKLSDGTKVGVFDAYAGSHGAACLKTIIQESGHTNQSAPKH